MDTKRANALNHELLATVARTTTALPQAVYDLLADLRSHLQWAGEQQAKNYRLVSMEAPDGPATVGTEFSTVGADPMGELVAPRWLSGIAYVIAVVIAGLNVKLLFDFVTG